MTERKGEKSNEKNLNINKVSKKLSLIELTKKALHLFDDEYIDKNKNGNKQNLFYIQKSISLIFGIINRIHN